MSTESTLGRLRAVAPGRPPPDSGGEESADHMSRWVELFYDLAFVAAILILSSAASHAKAISSYGWIALVFAASWWVWFVTTLIANRYHMTDSLHRVLLLFQMLVIVLMAMETRTSLGRESRYLIGEYGVLLITTALVAYRGARRADANARYAYRLAAASLLGALGMFVAAPLAEPWRGVIAGIALAVAVVPAIGSIHEMEDFTEKDEAHLVERMGAFTLIVCGESFIEVATSVSNGSLATIDLVSLIFEFVLVLAVFTSYFEDIPAAGLQLGRLGWWAGGHLVVVICIAAIAIAPAKLVDLTTSESLPDRETLTLTIPLAALYLALAGVGACTRRRPIAPLALTRVATAVVVGVCGIVAWRIASVHLAEALPIITAVVVLHAVAVVRLQARTYLVPR
ncbi:MAG: low temperature requirement protein A [Acidimicrobiales bacterium]